MLVSSESWQLLHVTKEANQMKFGMYTLQLSFTLRDENIGQLKSTINYFSNNNYFFQRKEEQQTKSSNSHSCHMPPKFLTVEINEIRPKK